MEDGDVLGEVRLEMGWLRHWWRGDVEAEWLSVWKWGIRLEALEVRKELSTVAVASIICDIYLLIFD
jgi:hypothetical protein